MNFGFKRRGNQGKPKVLSGRDIPSLAKYIKSNDCQNVFLMANLARLNLPYPEAVFEINFFRRNPVPFYTLAHELYPGKFRPTITHSFVRLLSEKSLLHTCYTQNIDTLERRAGVPDDKIIEAHGSFATQRCINCREEYDDEEMKKHVLEKKIPKCPSCGGYVKPDIVFFGEGLPPHFMRSLPNLREADLLIIMGTSLTVHPFASLAGMVDSTCPRVLINLDQVGDIGSRPDDVVLLGQCDDIVRELCKELGWEEDLNKLWAETEETVLTEQPAKKEEVLDVLEEMQEQFEHLAVQEGKATEKSSKPKEDTNEDNAPAPSGPPLEIPPKPSATVVDESKKAGEPVKSDEVVNDPGDKEKTAPAASTTEPDGNIEKPADNAPPTEGKL
ncbi:hypothetical protein CVT26_012864 [Gymnopilus dilepis]|uniref:Deacetylase sirtuin-type domain-containing protein n=1 Tax=Gymnopilus dilepis TaxID=231916 RepID=A0A409YNS4_9AGAR|nr:hypothetical protein CVT26_012864 [Gymnopilus dilepis]